MAFSLWRRRAAQPQARLESGMRARRLASWLPATKTLNTRISCDGELTLRRAREIVTAVPLAASAVDGFVGNVVGCGIKPSPLIADARAKRRIQDAWRAWSDEADADAVSDVYGLQALINTAYQSFPYGGITFHNYRGTDDASTVAIAADKAKFFPVGAPGVFKVALSPAEFFDYVNTPGLDLYAMTIPDRERNAWVKVEVYSYPLFICTRPEMLQRAKRA